MMRAVIRASPLTDPRDTLQKANTFVLIVFVISDSPATLVWPFPTFLCRRNRIMLVC